MVIKSTIASFWPENIFVCRHYLLREANSFLGAELKEKIINVKHKFKFKFKFIYSHF